MGFHFFFGLCLCAARIRIFNTVGRHDETMLVIQATATVMQLLVLVLDARTRCPSSGGSRSGRRFWPCSHEDSFFQELLLEFRIEESFFQELLLEFKIEKICLI